MRWDQQIPEGTPGKIHLYHPPSTQNIENPLLYEGHAERGGTKMNTEGSSKRSCTRRERAQSNGASPSHKTDGELLPNGIKVEQDQTPDAGNLGGGKGKGSRSSTRKRKSSSAEGAGICPVCGITVRPSEMEQHFRFEVQQLDQIVRRGRVVRDSRAQYALAKERLKAREKEEQRGRRRGRSRRRPPSDSDESSSDADSESSSSEVDSHLTLLEVRGNRHARERKKELNRDPSCNPETMLCPVCFSPLSGSAVDRNKHVEGCLASQPSTSTSASRDQGDSSSVDVDGDDACRPIKAERGEEGEGQGGFEVYEWMGETRVRTVSLVPGGYQGLGYQTIKAEVKDEEDDDLDVDGDETAEFGDQQYTEEDVGERCPSRASSRDTGEAGYEDHVSDNLLIEGCHGNGTGAEPDADRETKSGGFTVKHIGLPTSGIQMIVENLKARVRELEADATDGRSRLKCQICMESYEVPLVSVQCWHVHCEQCWLQTLASKKLCPQCQMITAPSQLRRIYL